MTTTANSTKAERAFNMFFPVIGTALDCALQLFLVAISSGVHYLLSDRHFWDLEDEWYVTKQKADVWVKYWRTGMSI